MVELGFPRRIFFREDAGEALKMLLSDRGIDSVLVVTDPVVSSMHWFKDMLESVKSVARVSLYTGVEPEPGFEVADGIASAAREAGARAIIAVGGGSVIDAAKSGLVKLVNPEISLDQVAPFTSIGVEGSGVLLVAVPTTSGSGSDASYGIVLTRRVDGREKVALGSYELIPYASILDPRLPKFMPRRLAIGTGLDVLAHSLEALVSINSNPVSDALSLKAIELVFRHLPRIAGGEGSDDDWAMMHIAATMAGMAFTNSGLGLAHAIAHPLGARLGIHHGTIVATVLPYVIEYNSRSPEALSKYRYVKDFLEKMLGAPERGSLEDHVRALYRGVGHPVRLRDLAGVSEEEYRGLVDEVAESALRDPDIAFNPVVPTVDDIADILRKAY